MQTNQEISSNSMVLENLNFKVHFSKTKVWPSIDIFGNWPWHIKAKIDKDKNLYVFTI